MHKEIDRFIDKIEEINLEKDLSRNEDLGIALMHLVSLEEHLYFTAMKTNEGKYLGMLDEVRGLRRTFMKKIVKNPSGEEWCISKHLLGSSMRLFESGSKEEPENRKPYYQAAFDLFSLFFAINLPLDDSNGNEEAEDEKQIRGADESAQEFAGRKDSFLKRAGSLFKSLVDCCRE